MGKILVIAEKPAVASDIAKALRQLKRFDGYFEGDKYVITWAYGHIVSRKELYEYDPNINRAPQNRAHVLETVPYFPEQHDLKLALQNLDKFKGNKEKYNNAKSRNELLTKMAKVYTELFNRKDIDFIVNACDAGREGEAIFWQIYDFFNCSFPVKRFWESSNLEADIVRGFEELKPASDFENIKQASYARAEMDWEHGLNLSVLYASLYGAQLSVGRIQTPILNMIVEREKAIRNFKPEDYYSLIADFSTNDKFKYKGRLVINEELGDFVVDGKIKDMSKINEIMSKVENTQGYIKSIDKTKKKESPKLLYSLSELQIEMSSKHKMSAKEVLGIAQSLYETHKLTTYPRTSSQYLRSSMRDDIFNRLNYLPKEYSNIIDYAKKSNCFFEKILDDSKVEDHYAIIPTVNSKNYDFSKLTKKEMIVYTAIVKRFISIFMPTHEYESTVLTTTIAGYDFKTTGKKVIQQGWKALYTGQSDDESDNSNDDSNQDLTYGFTEQMPIFCDSTEKQSKKTKGPKRYTDGTLIASMKIGGAKNENITDPEKLELLKEKGLGTEATRAELIENILSRGFVEKDKKNYLIPTEKGFDFIDKITVDMIKSTEITSDWEYQLRLLEKGTITKTTLLKEVRAFISDCVDKIKASYKEGDRIASGNSLDCNCPLCGGSIIKSPKAYFCNNSSKGCKFVVFPNILGKTLKDSDVKDICTKGSTKIIKGFNNPNRKDANGKPLKFDASLVYNKEAMKLQFDFGNKGTSKERKETDFKCPKCSKPIVEFETGYGCSGFKDGCKFSLFKNFYNRKLGESDVRKLLEEGSTDIFENLSHPKNPNRLFSAKIVLKNDMPEVIYLNENNEEDIGKPSSHFCPCCKGSMVEYSRAYRCEKCKFIISKSIAGVTLNQEQISEICTKGKMIQCVDFTKNDGGTFKARLVVNSKSKKLEFQLDSKASNYTCPLCKSEVGERDTTYSCLGCGLTVWKSINSTKLSDDTIAEIFKNKQTSDYLDLVSAKGNPFRAKLVVNSKTKKLEFMFEPKSK